MTHPTRQLAIDLPYREALGRADFLVSDCNRAALGCIEGWPDWPARRLALYGPEGSGKTHLGHMGGGGQAPFRQLGVRGEWPPPRGGWVVGTARAASREWRRASRNRR